MTGKQFKAFAEQVPDDAEIEVQTHHVYPARWDTLTPTRIRAMASQVIVPDEANVLRNLQTVNG